MTRVRNADIERFTEGDCHIFARALHVATGWPIHCFDADGPDLHAFVLAPDGRAVDIEGFHDLKAFKCRWGETDVSPFEWRTLRKEWGGPDYGNHSYRRAKQLVPLILEQA